MSDNLSAIPATEKQIVVTHPIGLHGRPSVKLTKIAKEFKCEIRIFNRAQQEWVDAKSIVKVMNLKVNSGDTITLQTKGVDAVTAMEKIVELIQRNFE